MRLFILSVIISCILLTQTLVAQAGYLAFDGVVLPKDTKPLVQPSAGHEDFHGVWVGAWGGTLKHVLIIESVAADGSAKLIYAYGDAPHWGIKRGWTRISGKVVGDRLTAFGNGFEVTYDALNSDTLDAVFALNNGRSQATLRRWESNDLADVGKVKWNNAESIMLATGLQEQGKEVSLEVVLSRPEGKGPFPLVVLNHGSTGSGENQKAFKATWFDPGLAHYFTARGYLVAFPQRRGRGKSDGLYDEGFAKDRKRGYACNAKRSLRGADRALGDVDAAVNALQKRSDVKDGALLIGGVSRGGILSAAYAGKHPDKIAGVVNFVGGWISEGCRNADKINHTLFKSAAAYKRPMLWLYGEGDPFYSLGHSQNNFSVFQKAGGTGEFFDLAVPGGNGHLVHVIQKLWRQKLDAYLDVTLPALP